MPSARPQTTPAIDKLTRNVGEIIEMAADLQHRGFMFEAATFAMMAAQRLQAVRALQRLHDAAAERHWASDGCCGVTQ